MYYTTVYRHRESTPRTQLLADLAVVIFLTGSAIAMLLFPHYHPSQRYLSALGTKEPAAFFFNMSVMLTALMLLPVFISLYVYLRRWVPGGVELMLVLAISSGLVSSVTLFMVGYLPATGTTLRAHNYVAMLFFILFALTFALLTLVLLRTQDLRHELEYRRPEDYMGLLFPPLVLLFADLTLWYTHLLQKFIVYIGIFYLLYLINRFYQFSEERQVYYHDEKFEIGEVYSLDQVILYNRINF